MADEPRVTSAWAVCDSCLCSIEVKVHPDNQEKSLPPVGEWDHSSLTCPICSYSLIIEEVWHG